MNNQCFHFSKTNIYDMRVALLKSISGSNYLGTPTLGLCKRAAGKLEESVNPLPLCYSIREWTHIYFESVEGKLFGTVTSLMSKGRSVLCYKQASWIKHSKNWDAHNSNNGIQEDVISFNGKTT
ncbi:hypothetical protein L195_g014579 [Trifolium pratense]|uniref:Uncharacterized protein n=1 Tax=Trifolium pratense TaxID=57577 RepID=A0A2K3PRD2_TRIPR|nr:hypothetical protein L195_g014579 [Trifolium pratense]